MILLYTYYIVISSSGQNYSSFLINFGFKLLKNKLRVLQQPPPHMILRFERRQQRIRFSHSSQRSRLRICQLSEINQNCRSNRWYTVTDMSSNHLTIVIEFDRHITKVEASKKCYYNFSKAKCEDFMNYIEASFQINITNASKRFIPACS